MAAWSKVLHYSCYELGHCWEPSCLKSVAEIARSGYSESFKVYATVYLATALLSKRKKEYYLKTLWQEVLRSSFFLGTNVVCFLGGFCVWRKVVGFYFFFNVFACAIPAGFATYFIERADRLLVGRLYFLSTAFGPAVTASLLAIILERHSRRQMLAVYMSNVATETLWRMGYARGMVKPVRHGQVLMFSVAVAVFMYLFRKKKETLQNGMASGAKFLVGRSEFPRETSDRNRNQPQIENIQEKQEKKPKRTPQGLQKVISKLSQGPKHPLCQHQDSCIASAIKGCIRMFGIGYVIQAALKLAASLQNIVKKPKLLIQLLTNKDTFKLGAFLGSFAGIFKGVNCALRWLTNKDSDEHRLISGFLAGWSMMFYKSITIAMYIGSKLLETLYFLGIEAGYLPYIKYGEVILYTLSTSLVLHAAVFEPQNLRPAYWKFLLKLTNQRFAHMNRKLLDCYGTDASLLYKDYYPKYDKRYTDL